MKKMPKKLLDRCIEATRLYWNSPYEEDKLDNLLILKKKTYRELGKQINVSDYAISQFIDGILNGIYPDAENDEIYCALRCLGWDVVDE